jgi:hypothetical protein
MVNLHFFLKSGLKINKIEKYRYEMADIVTREQFIEACPPDLKKRIEDFFVFYSQKKKSNGFSGPPEGGKKFHKNDGGRFEKKNNLAGFKKPFEKKVSEFEQVVTDFKGILSKLNENNQDSIWKEIQTLRLERYIPSIGGDEGWNDVAPGGKSISSTVDNYKDISTALYQYSRNCNMYLKQYFELLVRLHSCNELATLTNDYIDFAIADLDSPKSENKEFNLLTHSICCEMYMNDLMTESKYIIKCVLQIFNSIKANLESGKSVDEHMEILIQNITKCGEYLTDSAEVQDVIKTLIGWKNEKKFTGRIYFNLMDLVELIEQF